ncbi:MAG TPA: AraC family transcriptional regulator [Gemmatimonadales bacterium]|nr:AraC family transcriptional regulator [Gemmatimonadales bacterium]
MQIDRTVFETAHVTVGAFRCPITYPSFRYTGPTERHLVVFPRTGVWIRHAGSRAFAADPRVVTIYNAGQEYTREPIHPEGDRSDWFALSPELAREAAGVDSDRPFHFEFAESDPRLYCRQRMFFDRLEAGVFDPLEAEEEVLAIVTAVLRRARCSSTDRERPSATHRDLAEHARAELVRTATLALSLGDLAARVGASPWHLCRVFRAVTGSSLHAFRMDLRLRLALERLEDPRADLSRLAFELGFSSHSHFTSAMRSRLGRTPSAFRHTLAARRHPSARLYR